VNPWDADPPEISGKAAQYRAGTARGNLFLIHRVVSTACRKGGSAYKGDDPELAEVRTSNVIFKMIARNVSRICL